MQAVKVIIPGSFWDSQIYSSYLHLFLDDGSIAILDWKGSNLKRDKKGIAPQE